MAKHLALKEFGTMLKRAREEAGMSQFALGVELGLGNGQFISNIERGLRALPAKHIHHIAGALNLSENDLTDHLIRVHALRISERKIRHDQH